MTNEDRVAQMIAGRKVALRGKAKAAAALTVPKATTQARRIVDRVMPGAGATVESRLSHDLATDTPIVITEITFPEGHADAAQLAMSLCELGGIDSRRESARITVIRKR